MAKNSNRGGAALNISSQGGEAETCDFAVFILFFAISQDIGSQGEEDRLRLAIFAISQQISQNVANDSLPPGRHG